VADFRFRVFASFIHSLKHCQWKLSFFFSLVFSVIWNHKHKIYSQRIKFSWKSGRNMELKKPSMIKKNTIFKTIKINYKFLVIMVDREINCKSNQCLVLFFTLQRFGTLSLIYNCNDKSIKKNDKGSKTSESLARNYVTYWWHWKMRRMIHSIFCCRPASVGWYQRSKDAFRSDIPTNSNADKLAGLSTKIDQIRINHSMWQTWKCIYGSVWP
jgi:hypothetical protein